MSVNYILWCFRVGKEKKNLRVQLSVMSSDHVSASESSVLLLLKEQVMYSFHQHKCWSAFSPASSSSTDWRWMSDNWEEHHFKRLLKPPIWCNWLATINIGSKLKILISGCHMMNGISVHRLLRELRRNVLNQSALVEQWSGIISKIMKANYFSLCDCTPNFTYQEQMRGIIWYVSFIDFIYAFK